MIYYFDNHNIMSFQVEGSYVIIVLKEKDETLTTRFVRLQNSKALIETRNIYNFLNSEEQANINIGIKLIEQFFKIKLDGKIVGRHENRKLNSS